MASTLRILFGLFPSRFRGLDKIFLLGEFSLCIAERILGSDTFIPDGLKFMSTGGGFLAK